MTKRTKVSRSKDSASGSTSDHAAKEIRKRFDEEPEPMWRVPGDLDIVEKNGGIHNTVAMGSLDKGYKDCTPEEKEFIDRQVAQVEKRNS